MKTCKVSDLFSVEYGNSLELVYLEKKEDGINFISRTAKRNGVSAKVAQCWDVEPFPAGAITVAVGGSVLETFLQRSPFYTGFHVMVLTPRQHMSTEVKLFYCYCIQKNQYKYSYGRQANATLPNLQIPTFDSIPTYVTQFSLYKYGRSLLNQLDFANERAICGDSKGSVAISELFEIRNGLSSSLVTRRRVKENENWIPYIRPSYRQETCVDAFVNKKVVPEDKVFPKGTLYVSTDGQGSHTYSYVSTGEFVPNSNVSVLIPKRPMSLQEKLYYAHCITQNRYKFSYGRKPKGKRLEAVLVPDIPPAYVLEYNIANVITGFSNVLDGL